MNPLMEEKKRGNTGAPLSTASGGEGPGVRCHWVMKDAMLIMACLCLFQSKAQPIAAASIYAKQTLATERLKRREGLYKFTILPLLHQSPDSTNEFQFQTALWNMSQFMLQNDTTRRIVDVLFGHYKELQSSTRRSLWEVVYGLYPTQYRLEAYQSLKVDTTDIRLPIVALCYLFRMQRLGYSVQTESVDMKEVESRLSQGGFGLYEEPFGNLLMHEPTEVTAKGFDYFFRHQKALDCKIIYSLQRPDRNYSGIAFIQNRDGSFVKDSTGRLKTFVQLARSASNLPYFITNGNTPQGAYRIAGIEVSQNNAIGPTPNIQLRMPYEVPGDSFFVDKVQPIVNDSVFFREYKNLFPFGTEEIGDFTESYYAGKCGRSAIIAHGTTLDPSYYRWLPLYPCTPTLGCLCAKETWDPYTGRLQQSDQLNMVNAFLSTPGTDGYLFVINLENTKSAVTPDEVTALVNAFENHR